MKSEALPNGFARQLELLWGPLAEWIAGEAAKLDRTLVVGLCGPQGSGKTTGVEAIRLVLAERGVRAVVLALDDFYLDRSERAVLASKVHPLFATRGPPGTHDVALGLTVMQRLARSGPVRLPRFDKGIDDREAIEAWPAVEGAPDVVLLEGWCVGAVPEPVTALAQPINSLESEADPKVRWRGAVNTALASDYQSWFGKLDRLILLRAPSFQVVAGWRMEQEHKLRVRTGLGMTDAEVLRFVQHYERLTRYIDREMPARADVVAALGVDRSLQSLEFKAS